MAVAEVSDMIKLASEAFQCLRVFNLDLLRVYNQVFGLLCLRRKFWAMEGVLEKLPLKDGASLGL